MAAKSFKRENNNDTVSKKTTKRIVVFSNRHRLVRGANPTWTKREVDLYITEIYEAGRPFWYKWFKTIEVEE